MIVDIYIRNGDKTVKFKINDLDWGQIVELLEKCFGFVHEKVRKKEQSTVTVEPAIMVKRQIEVNEREPEHWKTGIMNKEGVPHYKLRLECPNCGIKKNLYKPLGIEKVECRECNALVKVEPATEKGFGPTEEHRDTWGNFMIARKPANRPRQLPMLGQETRSTFPIAELITEAERNELVDGNREG